MTYSYGSLYGSSYGRSSSRSGDKDKKKKKKRKKSDYIYFILGLIAYPLAIHFLNPAQQITIGQGFIYTVILGVSALVGAVISHRLFGIVDKFASMKEYGKFFFVFMLIFGVITGYMMKNQSFANLSNEIIKQAIPYAIATFVSVYASAPKKTPKSKIAVATLVIGYLLYAGLMSFV